MKFNLNKSIIVIFSLLLVLTFFSKVTGQTYPPPLKVISDNGQPDALFGNSVSISGDTAIIGTFAEDIGSNVNQGAAYIFVKTETGWIQQTRIVLSDGLSGDNFGREVAIYGDTVAIKSYGVNNQRNKTYIYVRNNSSWNLQYVIPISGEGNIALYENTLAFIQAGKINVYLKNGTSWLQQAIITSPTTAFTGAISLSGDTLIAGSNLENSNKGVAHVFMRNGTTWYHQSNLRAPDGVNNDYFGNSVSIDVNTLVVGANGADINSKEEQGAAYVFARTGTPGSVWVFEKKLIASDGIAWALFGGRVKVLGSKIFVGAFYDDVEFHEQGSAYVFEYNGTFWLQSRKIFAPDATSSSTYFGSSLDSFGDLLIVGVHGDKVGSNLRQGSAYFFSLTPETTNCNFLINPLFANFTISGGNSFFDVATSSGCSWTANSNSNWITTNSNGNGNGTVNFSVAENTGQSRSGIINVGDKEFTINQQGNNMVDGSNLTNLNASNITSGTLDPDRLPIVPVSKGGTGLTSSGTAGNFLRSDGTGFTSSPLQITDLPDLNANFVQNSTTTQANANFNISGNGIVGGNLTVNGLFTASGENITNLNASNLTSGTIDNARLGIIPTANIADNSITTAKIGDSSITAAKIANNQVVKGFNGLTDNVTLVAGDNVTITPNGNSLTISSAGINNGNFIQNNTVQQANSNFNISGNGIATNLTATSNISANNVNANSQYNLNGNRILSNVGTNNFFVGIETGLSNSTGFGNAFFGTTAGKSNTTGSGNSFFGSLTGSNNLSGDNNSFFGNGAGNANNTGAANSFFGSASGFSNTTGQRNSFFGTESGKSNTIGNQNSFFGGSAGKSNTTAVNNSFFGFQSGFFTTTGVNNTFVGSYSGFSNTTGMENAFFGTVAGNMNTTGSANSFFGNAAGYDNTIGESNSFFGYLSGRFNTTGNSNTFLGRTSGYYNSTGNYNTFIGHTAGLRNTTGNDNVFLGSFSGDHNVSGNGNIFIGTGAGIGNSFGHNNTIIGLGANVYYDSLSFATAIGGRAVVNTSDTIVLGKQAGIYDGVSRPADKIRFFGLGSAGTTHLCINASNEISNCSSSLRYKTNIEPFSFGLSYLKLLQPITFDWKGTGIKDVGFGAEDVAAINPLFATYNENGEIEGVKYDRISTVLVNSVKEQQIQIEQLREENQQLQKTVDGLKELVCLNHPKAKICQ